MSGLNDILGSFDILSVEELEAIKVSMIDGVNGLYPGLDECIAITTTTSELILIT